MKTYRKTLKRNRLVSLCLLCALCLYARGASAYDYSGRFNLGLFSATEKYAVPTVGTDSNDASVVTARGFLELVNIGDAKQEAIVDFRDKHDMYGKVDQQDLRLVAANRFQLRQLAYKSSRQDAFQWAVGRVQIPDAGLARNDGVVVGYKSSKEFYIGGFGGLGLPRSEPNRPGVVTDAPQGGVLTTYQTQGGKLTRSMFASFAAFVAPNAIPTADVKSETYFFSRTFFIFTPAINFNSVLLGTAAPKSGLQNLALNLNVKPYKGGEANVGYYRLDLTAYEERREIRDALVASDYQEVSVRLKQTVTPAMGLKLDSRYGLRSSDKLQRYEILAGPALSGLVGNKVNAGVMIGGRRNYTSRDQIGRLLVDFYSDTFTVDAQYESISENYDSGLVLHASIVDLGGSAVFSNSYLAGLNLQYMKDERVSVTSFLVSFGYKFGNRLLNQQRKRAPAMEDQ